MSETSRPAGCGLAISFLMLLMVMVVAFVVGWTYGFTYRRDHPPVETCTTTTTCEPVP